eukprot:scaffold22646_cov68-Phaeocystis_antarctica.AAC.3
MPVWASEGYLICSLRYTENCIWVRAVGAQSTAQPRLGTEAMRSHTLACRVCSHTLACRVCNVNETAHRRERERYRRVANLRGLGCWAVYTVKESTVLTPRPMPWYDSVYHKPV